jgi:hypothetical protein
MSFFNLFKKSPQKETNQERVSSTKPWMDNPLASQDMQKKRYDAAMEFLSLFQEKIPLVGGKPHPGTVFSVIARLAGSNLFRAVNGNKEFPTGTVILSEEINEAYPQLLNLFALYCKQNGMDVMSKPLVATFPEQDKPLMTVEQVLQEYQNQYHTVMDKHGLDYLESARAGMVICSIIFTHHCIRSKDIDPNIATGIVAMGVVEGAKTAPPPLNVHGTYSSSPSGNTSQNSQLFDLLKGVASNSMGGSGTRFILGEGMNSMKEALGKGGKYMVLHPSVTSQLQQKNIDPFLVYEAGLRLEMEAKISRIDYIEGAVGELLQEWGNKPQESAPVHVRLIIWLKENASAYGYEQTGNSWILK